MKKSWLLGVLMLLAVLPVGAQQVMYSNLKELVENELALWGGFEVFKPGFTFCLSAGNQVIYNDYPNVPDFVVDGHTVHITRNLCICDNTYTLGITDEYAKILGYKIMEVI